MDQGTVLVLGSGPIRIGQGIEFDYSCVHCVWALEELGYRAIIVNNNPETVSTDFDTGDGLYFEPVTLDDVLDVIDHERPIGTVVQFGGQTAINLADPLAERGVKILGTQPEAIAAAEDRDQFEQLLNRLNIPRPPGAAVRSLEEALKVAEQIGYPVLVRPSFVLGGRAMEIVYAPDQLAEYYALAEDANPGQPVLVDRYFLGVEAEVDVISDGEDTLVPGIMEHIERAGVHSGDSMAVYPPVTLSPAVQGQIVAYASRLAKALNVRGIMNLQFVIVDERAYVIEVNPRASRTVPYLSKVTGIPMVRLATCCMMGESLASMGYSSGLYTLNLTRDVPAVWKERPRLAARSTGSIQPVDLDNPRSTPLQNPDPPIYAVKAPVFSFQKLALVEPSLGPEMKSTGEIMGVDRSFEAALYKALVASFISFKPKGKVILTVTDADKEDAVHIAGRLQQQGYQIAATHGTHAALQAAGIESERLNKIEEGAPSSLDYLFAGEVSLMINTPALGKKSTEDAIRIRRACIETGVACITNIDTARALARALEYYAHPEDASVLSMAEYLNPDA